MVNRENLDSSDGENPTSEWDTLTGAQKDAAENESGSAEAQSTEGSENAPKGDVDSEGEQQDSGEQETTTPEKSESSQAENHEDGEEKEKIAEKIKVINLYGLGEVLRAIRAAGGDMYKFLSSEALILEHKDGESEEDAAKITFDELINQLKQDCGDRTVESTGANNNGETDGDVSEESGEDEDSDEDEEGNGAGVVAAAAGAGAVAAGAAAAHNNGESTNNGRTDAERNVEQAEKRKGLLDRLKKKGAWKKAVALGLVLTTLLAVGGGIRRNAEGPKEQDTAAVETYDDVEQENNFEILSMDESYRGRFANENNDGYNEKKEGKLSFSISFEDYCKELGDEALGKSDGELRKEYIKVVAMQPESLSSYIYYAHSIVDRVPALHDAEVAQGRRLNMQEINTVIESDEAVRDQALKEFWEWIDEAEVSKVSVTGPQWNVYMRNTKGEGQVFDHGDIELVTCHTYENGSSASLFENKQRNEQLETRDNCGDQAISQEKQEGVKEVDEDGNDVDPGPGDTDPDPDPGPGDSDPGGSDPGDSDPGDPDPGTPTEELDEKNPEDEDIDMPGDHEWVDEDKGPETSRQDIPDGYNPDQGNFAKPGETPGTSQGDVNPAGNVQEGAVDTSTTESADGSGQTIKEVVDNADTSTVTDTGEKVSDQTNGGTVQEQIHSETQVKEQEAAVQAQQQAEQERQEVNQQYGGEDGQINTHVENASAYNAGEY
jgi:hypothetical protein